MLSATSALRSTVDDPWESVARVVELHADADWGDVATNGTAMWHLWHTVDCFRHHAGKVIAGDLEWDGELANDACPTPAALRDQLRTDVDRFCTWVDAQSDDRLARMFDHGTPMNAQDMINLMIRHILWHTARAHGILVSK